MSDLKDIQGEILDLEGAAAALGVHSRTALEYFQTGQLKGRKVGHYWKTTKRAILNFVDGMDNTPAGQGKAGGASEGAE